jgi:hypothetical protein
MYGLGEHEGHAGTVRACSLGVSLNFSGGGAEDPVSNERLTREWPNRHAG